MRLHLILLSVLLFVCLPGCKKSDESPLGEHIQIDEATLHYKDGATKEDAEKVGAHLKEAGLFSDGGKKDIQLRRPGGTLEVSIVIKEGIAFDDENVLSAMRVVGGSLSQFVYDGEPVSIRLVDKEFETKKLISYEEMLYLGERHMVVANNAVYYTEGATLEDAKKVGEALKTSGAMSKTSRVDAQLARPNGDLEFRLVIPGLDPNDKALQAEIDQVARDIGENYFDGAPVTAKLYGMTFPGKKLGDK